MMRIMFPNLIEDKKFKIAIYYVFCIYIIAIYWNQVHAKHENLFDI